MAGLTHIRQLSVRPPMLKRSSWRSSKICSAKIQPDG